MINNVLPKPLALWTKKIINQLNFLPTSKNEKASTRVKKLIELRFTNFNEIIEYYKNVNGSYDMFDSKFVEVLHATLYNTRCKGSAGSGWDTEDQGESKVCSYVQYRVCQDCKYSVMFFLDKCPRCNCTDLKSPKSDTRWGIIPATHIRYVEELKEYRLTLIEPESYSPNCRKFLVKIWAINPQSEHLNDFVHEVINRSKKGTIINLLPYSDDFYYCDPILHLDGIIDIDDGEFDIKFCDIENKKIVEPPTDYKFKHLSSAELLKNKKLGKPRGDVKRK